MGEFFIAPEWERPFGFNVKIQKPEKKTFIRTEEIIFLKLKNFCVVQNHKQRQMLNWEKYMQTSNTKS